MKNERLKLILNILVSQKSPVAAQELADRLHVSKRTIFNDLDSGEMKQLLHGAIIERRPRQGLWLDATQGQLQAISRDLEPASTPVEGYEEIWQLLILLVAEPAPVTMDTLSRKMFRSIHSLTRLVDALNEKVRPFGCFIEKKPGSGLLVEGKEEDVQKMFRELCLRNMRVESVFSSAIISVTNRICAHAEIMLNTAFTEYDYNRLLAKTALLLRRVQLGYHCVTPSDPQPIPEYYIAASMAQDAAAALHMELMASDQENLARFLIKTRKVRNLNVNEELSPAILTEFIRKVSDKLNTDLTQDTELRLNLANHLRPAIRRLRYGVPSENPLLNRIRYDYSSVYITVMMTIDEIELAENIYFDTNELSYICMHIVAALLRKERLNSFSVLLIDDNGLSSQMYTKTLIEHQFKELLVSVCDSAHIPGQTFDLVINSTKKQLPVSCLQVSSQLEEEDFALIRHWLFSTEMSQILRMKNQMQDYILFFHDRADTKEELLTKYCGYLQETGYVDARFLSTVLEREKHTSTAIGRNVAVPHGAKESVLKSVIVLICLDEAIVWDGYPVNMVFLVAIDPMGTKEFNNFFTKLFNVISNSEVKNALYEARDVDQIRSILFEHTKSPL